MNILLTGKDGQVGFELQRALAPLGELVVWGRQECDLGDEAALRQQVRSIRPDVIVNPAAYTAVDKAESEQALAFAINADAPRVLAEEAQRLGALLVHYSTDYVFDGTAGGAYDEQATPNPQSVYGASKWAGERAVANACARHLIFRTSWVVGAHGSNFAKTMLRLASERERLAVVSDQRGAPTSAALIADVTAHAIRAATGTAASLAPGTYHLTASGRTNWHSYACHVIETARAAGHAIRVAPDAVLAIGTAEYPTAARRPANSVLDSRKLAQALDLSFPDWRCGVDHVLQQIL